VQVGHLRIVEHAFQDRLLGVFTSLDVMQAIFHGLVTLFADLLGTGHIPTKLRVDGDGVVHVGDATLIHQVHNQLQLMQVFKIGYLRGVTGMS